MAENPVHSNGEMGLSRSIDFAISCAFGAPARSRWGLLNMNLDDPKTNGRRTKSS